MPHHSNNIDGRVDRSGAEADDADQETYTGSARCVRGWTPHDGTRYTATMAPYERNYTLTISMGSINTVIQYPNRKEAFMCAYGAGGLQATSYGGGQKEYRISTSMAPHRAGSPRSRDRAGATENDMRPSSSSCARIVSAPRVPTSSVTAFIFAKNILRSSILRRVYMQSGRAL